MHTTYVRISVCIRAYMSASVYALVRKCSTCTTGSPVRTCLKCVVPWPVLLRCIYTYLYIMHVVLKLR